MKTLLLLLSLTLSAQAQLTLRSAHYPTLFAGSALDAATLDYQTRVIAAGGTISSTDLFSVNTFVVSAKAAGYWDQLTDVAPMAGDSAGALVKLKSHPFAIRSNIVVNSGTYSAESGWTLSGASTSFIDTGLFVSNSILPTNGNGASVWITRTATNIAVGAVPFGTGNGATPYYLFYANAGGSPNFDILGYVGYMKNTAGEYNGPHNATTRSVANTENNFYHWFSTNSINVTYVNGIVDYTNSGAAYSQGAGLQKNYKITVGGEGGTGSTVGNPFKGSFGYYAVDNAVAPHLQEGYYADVRNLIRSLGRLRTNSGTSRLIIPAYGQSLSVGATALGDATIQAQKSPFANYIGSPHFWYGTGVTNTARGISSDFYYITGWRSFQDQISWNRTNSGGGSEWDSVMSSLGVSGANFATLTTNTANYRTLLRWLTNQVNYELVTFGKSTVVPFVPFVHGEADQLSAAYGTGLDTMQQSLEIDIRATTGQTNRVPLISSQIASHGSITNWGPSTNLSSLWMLDRHERSGMSNVLSHPKYFLPHSDGIHLTAKGYQINAEYYGETAFKLLNTGTYSPLRPTNWFMSQGSNVIVQMSGAVGSLVLDTNSIPWMTNVPNYGFTYTNSSTSPAIRLVYLTNSPANSVVVNLDAADANTSRRVMYALNAASIDSGGTTNGPRGNLRDSNTATGKVTGTNLWNWAVQFSGMLTNDGSFTPASLTNLYLWYNASAATNVAGTGAEYLVDQSGNGRHMSQGTSGSRPIYNTGQVNGLPAWTFDGSDDSVGGSYNPGNSYGVFVLIQPTTFNEMRGFYDSAPSQANTFRMTGTGGSSLSVEIHDAAPFINQSSFGSAETLVYDYKVVVDGGGRVLESTKNLGTPVTGSNGSTTGVNWSNPRIGNINNGSPYWAGKIVQVIITSPYGSGTDRTNIVNYLKGLGGL